MLAQLKDKHILELLKGGYRRCGTIFRHPRRVMELRAEAERRGLI